MEVKALQNKLTFHISTLLAEVKALREKKSDEKAVQLESSKKFSDNVINNKYWVNRLNVLLTQLLASTYHLHFDHLAREIEQILFFIK